MKKQFSLAHLTVLSCPPPEMTYIAARAGYDYVSFRLIPMGVAGEQAFLPGDRSMIKKTRSALRETGVKFLDVELARILPDHDPKDYVPAMETAAELGARHVISSAWDAAQDDRDFIVERYGEICDLAKPFGLTVDLEFPTFSEITNLQEAVDVLRAAGRSNCGLLIDTLYCHFSRVNLKELAALPREWFHFMHICDTGTTIPDSREGLIHVARDARLYVGEGSIDFKAILASLPAMPFSIELPNIVRIRELGFEEHARRCLETARNHLASLEFRTESRSEAEETMQEAE